MNSGETVFKQLLRFLPRYEFNKCVERYKGHYRVKTFSCYDQFLCLAYAQVSGRESSRDIETCLNSHHEKLYHVGFRGKVHALPLLTPMKPETIGYFRTSAISSSAWLRNFTKTKIWLSI